MSASRVSLVRFARSPSGGARPGLALFSQRRVKEAGAHRLGCTGCQHRGLASRASRARPPGLCERWGRESYRIRYRRLKKQKNDKKGTKKTTQPRKKLKFCMKILSFFTQKDLPASQKTEILHEKLTNNWQKSSQKEHPAPQKPEVLHEKLKTVLHLGILKKNSRPPTSPNF